MAWMKHVKTISKTTTTTTITQRWVYQQQPEALAESLGEHPSVQMRSVKCTYSEAKSSKVDCNCEEVKRITNRRVRVSCSPYFPTKVTNDRKAKDEAEADIDYHTQDSITSPSDLSLRTQAALAEMWGEETEPTTEVRSNHIPARCEKYH